MKPADFDNAAVAYDTAFTHTRIGKAQRQQVWEAIRRLSLPQPSQVIEINCGTGEDAAKWHQNGHHILATDLSTGMIEQATNNHPAIDFRVMDMRHIRQLNMPFDVLFSDFGGINCLSPRELTAFVAECAALSVSGNRLIWVIMGKKCRWDYWYLVLKGRFSERNRRNTAAPVVVNVDGTLVQTWYHSPREVRQIAAPWFDTELLRPIGYCVPPSYLSPFFEQRPRLLSLLRLADRLCTFSWLSNRSDHYLICLRKR